MVDTTPAVDRLVRERWLALAEERRLLLAASMFDTARALAEASFPVGLSESERRLRMCDRLYGPELTRQCAPELRRWAAERNRAG